MKIDRKSHKQVDDLINHSFSAIEGSQANEEFEFYISDQKELFNKLVQGLQGAILKPTKQTPATSLYTVHIYDESLELATTLVVRGNNQIEVNEDLYVVDDPALDSFEDSLFSKEHRLVLRDYQGIVTHMYEAVFKGATVSEQNSDWAEVIALARIARDIEVDLAEMELLSVAPTTEVAEQLIFYGITGSVHESALIEAIRNERYDVAEVLLEHEIGLSYDFALESVISPVAVAKLNQADEMVSLLLTYGFEDVSVDPKHIEAAQQTIDFESEDPEKIMEHLTEGMVPGIDITLPVSTKEIMEKWGDYTSNEWESALNYRRHYFFRLMDLHRENKNRDDLDVFGYMYEVPADEPIHQDEITQVLGEPDFVEEFEFMSEMGYTFGKYGLTVSMELDGHIRYVHYYYESEH